MCTSTIPDYKSQYRFTSDLSDPRNRALIEKAIIWNVRRVQPFSKRMFLFEHYNDIDNRFDTIDYDDITRQVHLSSAGISKIAKLLGTHAFVLREHFFKETSVLCSTTIERKIWKYYSIDVSQQTIDFIKYIFESDY